MPKTMHEVRSEVIEYLDLPRGWDIVIEPTTDNLLVSNNVVAFVITRNQIEDNLWKTFAKDMLNKCLNLPPPEPVAIPFTFYPG